MIEKPRCIVCRRYEDLIEHLVETDARYALTNFVRAQYEAHVADRLAQRDVFFHMEEPAAPNADGAARLYREGPAQ